MARDGHGGAVLPRRRSTGCTMLADVLCDIRVFISASDRRYSRLILVDRDRRRMNGATRRVRIIYCSIETTELYWRAWTRYGGDERLEAGHRRRRRHASSIRTCRFGLRGRTSDTSHAGCNPLGLVSRQASGYLR